MMRIFLVAVILSPCPVLAGNGSTAFTYQGRLDVLGVPADGLVDLRFKLFDDFSDGTELGSMCYDDESLHKGLFTVILEFGQQYATDQQRFLQVEVRIDTGLDCKNDEGFTALSPRQQLRATPLALHANSAFALDAPDGSRTNAVFVDNQGDVGIGTQSPFSPLHISAPSPILALQDSDDGASGQVGWLSFLDSSGFERGRVGFDNSANAHARFINYRAGGNTSLGAGGGDRLTVTPNGNVGIGTTAPNFQLSLGASTSHTKIALYETSPSDHYGMGVVSGHFSFHLGGTGASYVFYDSPGLSKELVRIRGNGRTTIDGDVEIGIGSGDYHHLRMGGGNSDGFLYGSFARLGDGIHMGYNYYANAGGGNQVIRADGQTSRITTGYGHIALATGGTNAPPVDRLTVDSIGHVRVMSMPFGDFANVQYNTSTHQIGYDDSTRRHKENIKPLQVEYERLLDAQPVTYTRPGSPDRWEIGFIAEDMHDLGLKELVSYDAEGRPDGYNYEKSTLYLVAIAKAQKRQILEQQERLAATEQALRTLSDRVAELGRGSEQR